MRGDLFRHLGRWMLAAAGLVALPAGAASYVFPGALPAGCSGSSGNYTCGALTLNWNDSIAINSPRPATITVNGDFSGSNNRINANGASSDLNLVVNGNFSLSNDGGNLKGNLTASGSVNTSAPITGDVSAGTSLTTNSSVVITGNVSAGGAANLGYRTRISGTTRAASITGSSACVYGDTLTATSGAVNLASDTRITGNIEASSSAGNITLGSSTSVSGSLTSGGNVNVSSSVSIGGDVNAAGNITTGWQSHIDGAVTAGATLTVGGNNIIQGDVVAAALADNSSNNRYRGSITTSGAITLSSTARVSGNVIASGGNISLASSDRISGCLMTSASNQITLGWHARATSVCCLSGGNCGTACISNNSGFTLPATAYCQSVAGGGSASGCSNTAYAGGSLSVGNDSQVNGFDVDGSGNALDSVGNLSTASQTLGALTPASFPSYNGTTDYSGSASNLGSRCSQASPCDQVTFTSGTLASGTYYINSLTINGTVTFSGGTIYAQTVTVNEDRNVHFTAVTDFRVASSVSIGKDSDLRGTGAGVGTVPARFYLYNGADFTAGKDGHFEGIVVGPDSGSNITFGEEWNITGGFIAGGNVSLGKESDITFNSTVEAALTSSGACGGSSPPVAPDRFNCVEVGAGGSGNLYTKLAGTTFNLDVLALKADGSVESDYADQADKSVTVALYESNAGGGCVSALSPAISQTLTFTAASDGRRTASFTVDKAYANLRCRATDGTVSGCSTDNFAVRPTALTVSSTANADAAGTSASATPAIKAGGNFSLSATAIAGYNGTPKLDASKLQAHAGAATSGTVSGTFSAANAASGVATGTTFSYSEVGYFRYASQGVYDDTFTAVDSAKNECSNDFANTPVGGKYGCKFGNTATTDYFGRFTPDHFELTAGTLSQGCGSFTYFGQEFTTAFTLTARNAANATTFNYAGSFARLDLGTWSNYAFSSPATLVSDGSTTTVTLVAGSTPPTGSWNSGAASISVSHQAQRVQSGALPAPANVTVKALPVDPDTVTLTAATAVHAGTVVERFGRLRLTNAYGSERLALPVPLKAEYWNGSGFVSAGDDNCTNLTAPTLTFHANNADNQLASGETTASYAHNPLVSGNAGLSLSAPGAGNFGYLDLSVAAPGWLDYNWDGSATGGNLYDDDPRARAAFGKRRNAEKIIYRREVY